MLPEVVPLAGVDELGNVELVRVELDEVHELLRPVLSIEDGKLRVHADVRAVAVEPVVQEADELLETTLLLILRNEVLEVVRMHYDVHGSGLRSTELLGLDARYVHLPPGLGIACLPRRLHCLAVLAQTQVARRELGTIGYGLEEDLGSLVGVLLEQAVANSLDVGSVGTADKAFHFRELVGLTKGVHQLRVDEGVLDLPADHQQIARQLLKLLHALHGLDDLGVVSRVLCFKVGVNGLGHLRVLQVRPAELVPDRAVAAPRCKFLRPLYGSDVVEQGVHRLSMQSAALVDEEGLLVEAVRLAQRDPGDLRPVVRVQAADVVHDPRLVGPHCGQDEEVLQICILAKVSRLVEDDLLKKLDELVWQVCGDECLHRTRNLVDPRAFRQRGADDLLDDTAAVLVLGRERKRPELLALPLHQVLGLQPEEAVSARKRKQLLVTRAPSTPVGNVCQVRVAFLAMLAYHSRVVEGVCLEEVFCILVGVYADLRQCIVEGWLLATLGCAALKPVQQNAQAVPPLHLGHQRLHGACSADRLQEFANKVLWAIQVNESTDNDGALGGAHLGDINLDVH
mmetsp:Transcript_131667/g.366980  ORF Transcript_131667/g.366980 Transcript_131667/m.366980 type:complete len:569 (+) Transcript_131667:1593-3299(+)